MSSVRSPPPGYWMGREIECHDEGVADYRGGQGSEDHTDNSKIDDADRRVISYPHSPIALILNGGQHPEL